LIDRELYLPKSWTDDRERCRAAGTGDDVPFATKIEHFQAMLQRALDAKVPFAWVTADQAYGQVKRLRYWLEQRTVAHVLATKVNDTVITTRGGDARVDTLVAVLPRQAWKRLSAGPGELHVPAEALGFWGNHRSLPLSRTPARRSVSMRVPSKMT
jgi:SRSO17 transposase